MASKGPRSGCLVGRCREKYLLDGYPNNFAFELPLIIIDLQGRPYRPHMLLLEAKSSPYCALKSPQVAILAPIGNTKSSIDSLSILYYFPMVHLVEQRHITHQQAKIDSSKFNNVDFQG